MVIALKTPEQIKILNEANRIVHSVLDEVENNIQRGVSTLYLDQIAETETKKYEAEPAFKGYKGFPNSLCVSINEEVVHGIPSDRKVKGGDIISIDFGVKYKEFFGDAARTIIVGEVGQEVQDLVKKTKDALWAGINAMKVGNRLWDINQAINKVAVDNKYGFLKEYSGHGIGQTLHDDPPIFNWTNKNIDNIRLQEGLVIALEPMFCLGNGNTEILEDGWTVITSDCSISAHWEYSVAIVNGKAKILGV